MSVVDTIEDADFVMIANAVQLGPSPGFWSGRYLASQEVQYSIQQVLQNRLDSKKQLRVGDKLAANHYIWKESQMVGPGPHLKVDLFRPENLLIVSIKYSRKESIWHGEDSTYEVMVASDELLSLVRAALAEKATRAARACPYQLGKISNTFDLCDEVASNIRNARLIFVAFPVMLDQYVEGLKGFLPDYQSFEYRATRMIKNNNPQLINNLNEVKIYHPMTTFERIFKTKPTRPYAKFETSRPVVVFANSMEQNRNLGLDSAYAVLDASDPLVYSIITANSENERRAKLRCPFEATDAGTAVRSPL